MAETEGVSAGGDGGVQSEDRADGGVSEETSSAVEDAMASEGDADPGGPGQGAQGDDPMTAEDAEAAQERLEVEGREARESFERREQAVAEMERAANEAALDAAVETHEWTAEEQAAINRGTAEGAVDAAEGWVSDVVDGVVETATLVGQAAVVGANSGAQVIADMGLEQLGPIGQVMDFAAEVVDFVIPDAFAQEQAQSLQDKADALVEQIEAIPEIPEALREKFEADLALADAMEAAYVSGRADPSVLEESARLRAQTVTEMGILAAEAGSLVLGGAGLAVKAVRGMGDLDLDLPGGAIGALTRSTDVASSLADDLRNFALGESGSVELPDVVLSRADLDAVAAARAADLHREARWDEYQARGGEWDYDRWSVTYEQNQTRAVRSNEAVARYAEENNWPRTEETVTVEVDGELYDRRLDLANPATLEAVEHKIGYQSLTRDNAWELERDAALVEDLGWDVAWSFDQEPSAPLRRALEEADISIEIRGQ